MRLLAVLTIALLCEGCSYSTDYAAINSHKCRWYGVGCADGYDPSRELAGRIKPGGA